ncbi:hypothetical protein OLMES_3379 [Oleiphilus messinensis]|uniref:N-acetyltransferase domain-containing protein n=1 Tax=Oleiphilus messinensis TaxID=141451 RepID=A0A1Y0IA70_9GAMM|nr:hypothetical protein [Oleiphilus messinensis]ARU57417.1 hypothetical protein OLMES_3379 [Oleiphilus messinensis]
MAIRFEIRPAVEEDLGALHALIKDTPQAGEICLNFERAPDFFHGTGVTTQHPEVWVMNDLKTHRLAGVFSIGHRDVYCNGTRQSIRYGNDLRIHPDYQGGRTLFRLFSQYRKIMQQDWMQTIILSDNTQSLNTVGSGRANLPVYFPYGTLHTHMVYLRRPRRGLRNLARNSKYRIRRAQPGDIERMQDYFNCEAPKRQFYPHYEFSQLETGDGYYRDLKLSDYFLVFQENELLGITGVWDQKEFKQTRVIDYQGKMKLLRHVNNMQSLFFGGLTLPSPGKTLNYLLIHTVLIKNDVPEVFEALFAFIFNEYSASKRSQAGKYNALICGLSPDDPLTPVLRHYRRQVVTSKHFIASYGEDPRPGFDANRQLYLEAARL